MRRLKRTFFIVTLAFSLVAPSLATSSEVEAKSVKVYYAKTSYRFHRTKRCRTLARSKKIYKCTKKKAKRKGLTKCKVCY